MTPSDPAPTSDRDASTLPEHPAGSDQPVSAGEALSGRGGTDGALEPNEAPSDDVDRTRADRTSQPERSRRADRSADRDRIEDDDSDIVEDAIEFFSAGGEDDSPAADSDAPAPG